MQLFDELFQSLENDLFHAHESIYDHDIQIKILLDHIKIRLEKFENKLSTETLNVEQFNSAFLELTASIEGSFTIMQTIFKDVSVTFFLFKLLFYW